MTKAKKKLPLDKPTQHHTWHSVGWGILTGIAYSTEKQKLELRRFVQTFSECKSGSFNRSIAKSEHKEELF